MKYVDQLFNRFKRLHAKAQYPGTGLGLALCKRIVERHRGAIWAQSQPDVGTTIFFHYSPGNKLNFDAARH